MESIFGGYVFLKFQSLKSDFWRKIILKFQWLQSDLYKISIKCAKLLILGFYSQMESIFGSYVFFFKFQGLKYDFLTKKIFVKG